MAGTAELINNPGYAVSLRDAIYAELGSACETSFRLEQSWTRLGGMLATFKAKEHWRELGYQTFDDFMLELREKFNRGRTQLYSYLSVAENLLSDISAEALENIGISKALELKRAKKLLNGKTLPEEFIEAAKDPQKTNKELRALISQTIHGTVDEKGTWFDFDGCFMTSEEREEFKEAVKVTIGVAGISKEAPEHIQRKEIFFAWLREFYGTHAAEFYGPKPPTPEDFETEVEWGK